MCVAIGTGEDIWEVERGEFFTANEEVKLEAHIMVPSNAAWTSHREGWQNGMRALCTCYWITKKTQLTPCVNTHKSVETNCYLHLVVTQHLKSDFEDTVTENVTL